MASDDDWTTTRARPRLLLDALSKNPRRVFVFLLLGEFDGRGAVLRLGVRGEALLEKKSNELRGSLRGGEVQRGPSVVVDDGVWIGDEVRREHGGDGGDASLLGRLQESLGGALRGERAGDVFGACGILLGGEIGEGLAFDGARGGVRGSSRRRRVAGSDPATAAARRSAVLPFLSASRTSAFSFTRVLTVSSWPPAHASIRGVTPSSSVASIFAPLRRSMTTTAA